VLRTLDAARGQCGGATREQVGELLALAWERVRQI
jgi:hypothetical protein